MMKVNKSLCLKLLLGITFMALVFHFLILIKVIPYEITWGGRLQNDKEMYVFEIFSIAINFFFLWVLLQKGHFAAPFFGKKTLTVILWIFFAIFALNTIGNLFAETAFEKSFTLVTLLNAVLIWLVNRSGTSHYDQGSKKE